MATIKVKKGDTLSEIAEDAGISLSALLKLNPQIKNPNLIKPGQVVTTSKPAPAGGNDAQNAARLAAEEVKANAIIQQYADAASGDTSLQGRYGPGSGLSAPGTIATQATPVAATPVVPVTPATATGTATAIPRNIDKDVAEATASGNQAVKDINEILSGLNTTATTATTAAPVFTQEELDAAIAAAVAAAEAKAADAAAEEKEDAEIAAAAAAAAAAGKGGGLTQTDLDRAIREALAKQTAATEAAAREAKATEDAKKLAVKVKASDRLTSMFAGYGLETLAGFINRRIMADVSEEMLLLELYDQPEYQLRFPGMKALRSKNKTITEKDYIDDEKAFIQTARFFDLPIGFYDSADDFGKLIGNLVSPKEYQERLQVGQDLARSMNPVARTQLQELYNVGEGGITAFVLDADKALPLIQKQAKAAQFVGFGRDKGFKLEGMTAAQAEQIAGTEAYSKLSSLQMEQALGQAAQLRQTQSRLTGIEGEVYNEQEALKAVIEGSPEALLASQQRAQREGARFGGASGITGSSLRSAPGI
jgi:LysM repeat protein